MSQKSLKQNEMTKPDKTSRQTTQKTSKQNETTKLDKTSRQMMQKLQNKIK